MNVVISKDGTPIAYQASGVGPPLVLLHGVGGVATRWAPISRTFAEHFRVCAVDRRGRGASGDADAYAIEREFEDVAAVVDALGEPANVLGHSYGAICALEAARLTPHMRKLILYEPPIPLPGGPVHPPGIVERLEALLEAGDRAAVLTTFTLEVVGMPPQVFETFRSSPAWPERVAAAHTLPRELRAHARYRFEPSHFEDMRVPTLLLLGGDSPQRYQAAMSTLHAALPNSRVVVLPGQQHIAMDTAPDLFAREVVAFLSEPD
jgi:pimeloyl-ACP methyl ester carboxylesterase